MFESISIEECSTLPEQPESSPPSPPRFSLILRCVLQLPQRLPTAAFSDADAYRSERLYTEELDNVLTPKMDGFRALFQV